MLRLAVQYEGPARQDAELQEAAKAAFRKFVHKNNKHPDETPYHALTSKLIDLYSEQINATVKTAYDRILQIKGMGSDYHFVFLKLRRDLNRIRGNFLPYAYVIGRERGIDRIKQLVLAHKVTESLREDAGTQWNIRLIPTTSTDMDGSAVADLTPDFVGLDPTPPDQQTLNRIQHMINGTEYSVGNARYVGKQRGPFVDGQVNKMVNRLASPSDAEELEAYQAAQGDVPDEKALDEFEKLANKANFWASELWATEEKGFIDTARDFQAGGGDATCHWAGPEDDASCDWCLDAMENSPYSPDECPEPGEGTCQCNCRHFVLLFGPDETEPIDQ